MTATTLIAPAATSGRPLSNPPGKPIIYPERDGKPMADNTRQFDTIVMIQGGLAALFADRPDVFVAGDLLWYPVEGDITIRAAPDAMVVFGRPPGHRGSYVQCQEDGIAPQVTFEVVSPGNTRREMQRKLRFYDRHGVEEYYEYDPDRGTLKGWQRRDSRLEPIVPMEGWISPRLGIRFSLEGTDLVLRRPDGQRFERFVELNQRANREQQRAQAERQRADIERQRARSEGQRADREWQRAEAERQRAERLAERLRALGIDPDQGD